MKKVLFAATLMATQLFYSQVDKKINAGLGLSIEPLSGNSVRFGPALKLDYNLTPKLGVGIRGMSVFGDWGYDSEFSRGNYKSKLDYTSGSDYAFGLDAIYHVVGNNQSVDKFGLRLECGVGYLMWSQNISVTDGAPVTDSLYFSYDQKVGENDIVLKLGLGVDYKVGPGKLFFDIPVFTPIYGTYYMNYSNQKTGPGISRLNDFSLSDSDFFSDFTVFLNLGYQISF